MCSACAYWQVPLWLAKGPHAKGSVCADLSPLMEPVTGGCALWGCFAGCVTIGFGRCLPCCCFMGAQMTVLSFCCYCRPLPGGRGMRCRCICFSSEALWIGFLVRGFCLSARCSWGCVAPYLFGCLGQCGAALCGAAEPPGPGRSVADSGCCLQSQKLYIRLSWRARLWSWGPAQTVCCTGRGVG